MHLYLDASAAIKLFSKEQESFAMADLIREVSTSGAGKVFASTLTRLETIRSLRWKGIDPSKAMAFLDEADLVDVKARDYRIAESAEPDSLRSLDSLHMTLALRLKELGIILVSYDKQLVDAAIANGLKVLSPRL